MAASRFFLVQLTRDYLRTDLLNKTKLIVTSRHLYSSSTMPQNSLFKTNCKNDWKCLHLRNNSSLSRNTFISLPPKIPVTIHMSLIQPKEAPSRETNKSPIEDPLTELNEMILKYKRMHRPHWNPRSYTHMTLQRRRKMKKHKRKKWWKKYLAIIKKLRLRKVIKTEKLFRAELLVKIKEAEEFNPEAYVQNILTTIDSMPQKPTAKEKVDKIRELIRKNRKETNIIAPDFKDFD